MTKPIALLFPGQGAQTVGMGVALAKQFEIVRLWYERAEKACELPLVQLIHEGPEDRLNLTENLQPALLMVEIGLWMALRAAKRGKGVGALGHSLGEYAALVAAGAISPAEAVRLVRKRGRYMQEAVPPGVGGMLAVIGLRREYVEQACKELGDESHKAWVSNDNGAEQLVVSGHIPVLRRMIPVLKEIGARRVVPLQVSAPFHSPLMESAAERLEKDLAAIKFKAPSFPVIANAGAEPYAAADEVAGGLYRQVIAPVRFRESLMQVPRFQPYRLVELGPRPVLSGLAKRVIPDIPVMLIDNPDNLAAALKEIS